MATASSANPPKQKRRNSEKRKEKSRDAARCRRSKESEIFSDLSEILPLPWSVSSHLDKASIMRLSIAYLRARNLLGSDFASDDEKKGDDFDLQRLDQLVPKILEGFLLVISLDGDIVYVTEDVSQHLGLPQVDLIGQSIYEYSHPCDHSEVKDALTPRSSEGNNSKSFFLRFKCTLTNKGRSVNLKSATYKVIHCTGRFVSRKNSQLGDYLVLMGEPIPHPSNIEGTLDSHTFLTKHSLDMKYIFVDDKITQFLGYRPDQLEGKSVFDFYHVLDGEAVLKHYKTMSAKGQSQTSAYRFLALHGGYVWIQTQSTVIYGGRDSRPQAVVCLHKVLSEIEEPDQIVSIVQTCSPAKISAADEIPKKEAPIHQKTSPTTSTSKMFAPRTADMDKGYLIVSETSSGTAFKEEPEDLTHLAPKAGDICIPLDAPLFLSVEDIYEDLHLSPGMVDCVPLTGFDFPAAIGQPSLFSPGESLGQEQEKVVSVTASLFSKDPFFFVNKEDVCGSSDHSISELFSPLTAKTPETYEEYIGGLPVSHELDLPYQEEKIDPVESFLNAGLDPTSPNTQESRGIVEDFMSVRFGPGDETLTTGVGIDEEEDFNFRAPFIPMADSDLPLFDCEVFLADFKAGSLNLPVNSMFNEESDPAPKIPQNSWTLAALLSEDKHSGTAFVTDNKVQESKKRHHWQSEDSSSRQDQHKKRQKQDSRAEIAHLSATAEEEKLWRTGEPFVRKQSDVKQPDRCLPIQPWKAESISNMELATGKLESQKTSNCLGLLAVQRDGQCQDPNSTLLTLLKQPSSWSLLQPSLNGQMNQKKKKDGFVNGQAVCPLLDLTSYDCEVNAPVQPAAGLLQGQELLRALDDPLNAGIGN